ncbi:MAG: phosphate ABC transporter permease subunit PstC [Candidatus Dormiibacterota bacterium]
MSTATPESATIRIAPSLERSRSSWRSANSIFTAVVTVAGLLVLVLIAAMVAFVLAQSWPAITNYGIFTFLQSTRWAPSEATLSSSVPNPYGILQFIYGTLLTSAIAMLIAVPASVAIALFITEVVPQRLRQPLSSLVDLLAAVPSVVYGFWGIFALLPAIRPAVVALERVLEPVPVVGVLFKGPYFGFSYLTASLVLSIMVLPIITAICREVFRTAPATDKEAAYALGATRWEMIRLAVLPRSKSGIAGASILGLGRALGETIAVTMVIGNSVLAIQTSLLAQGATMASVIANEFTEATQPFHLESLFVVGFFLLVIAVIVNAAARLIVKRAVAL